jgi:hypothetical protein
MSSSGSSGMGIMLSLTLRCCANRTGEFDIKKKNKRQIITNLFSLYFHLI